MACMHSQMLHGSEPLCMLSAMQAVIEGYLRPMLADNWDRGSLYSYRAFSFPSDMPYEEITQPVMFITGEKDQPLTRGAKKAGTAVDSLHDVVFCLLLLVALAACGAWGMRLSEQMAATCQDTCRQLQSSVPKHGHAWHKPAKSFQLNRQCSTYCVVSASLKSAGGGSIAREWPVQHKLRRVRRLWACAHGRKAQGGFA